VAQPTDLNGKLPVQKKGLSPGVAMPTLLLFHWHLQLTNGSANLFPKAVRRTLQNPSSLTQARKFRLQFPARCVLMGGLRAEGSAASPQKSQSFFHSSSWFLHVLKPLLYRQERLFSCIAFMQQCYSEAKDLVDS
jgi:hypothetical protein